MMNRKYKVLLTFIMIVSLVVCSSNSACAIKLNKKNAIVLQGMSITLKVKGTKKKVKWSSTNKKIAKVSSKGKVTGVKTGTVTIKAKVGKKTYKCKVYVKKRPHSTQISTTQEKKTEKPTGGTTEKSTRKPTEVVTTESRTTTEATTEKVMQPTTRTTTEADTEVTTKVTTQVTSETTTDESSSSTQVNDTPGGNEQKTPSSATILYNAGEYSITNVHTGEGTFYDRETPGASNLDYLEKDYFTCAMNNEDYMNGLAGAYIEITDKDGDKINAFVTDRLPEGKKGDVDLTRKTFEQIEPLITGRMNITWKIVPFPTNEPISYVFKPTSSQWWAEVQVRNGRYPIKKFEYFDQSQNKYVELERQEYNYFTAPDGMGPGPYKFRVTDFYGHVLVDTGIAMNSTESEVRGQANFPY